jgi:hypothetical protein
MTAGTRGKGITGCGVMGPDSGFTDTTTKWELSAISHLLGTSKRKIFSGRAYSAEVKGVRQRIFHLRLGGSDDDGLRHNPEAPILSKLNPSRANHDALGIKPYPR